MIKHDEPKKKKETEIAGASESSFPKHSRAWHGTFDSYSQVSRVSGNNRN